MSETEKRDVAHPHDSLVRNVLADTELVADLLRNYLAPEVVATLDLDSLKREAGDTVSSKLLKREGDLRYSARFKENGGELKLLLMLEHQSRPDRLMSFRMLEYLVAAYREHVPALKEGKGFPYPLAVVLHHGETPWNRIPPMRELIDMTPGVPNSILELPIYLIDAATLPADALRGHPMVCALLDILQSASTGRLSERVVEIFSRLQNVNEAGKLKSWSTALASYYLAVQGKVQENLDTLLQALKTLFSIREAEDMTVTFAQSWIEEGIAIGEARGEAIGEARGEARGKAIGEARGEIKSVLIFLESRFGEVPGDIQKKLTGMQDGGRIEKMIKLAATCQSLKEFENGL